MKGKKKTSPGANWVDLNILDWTRKPWFLRALFKFFFFFYKGRWVFRKNMVENHTLKGIPEPRKERKRKED